MTRAERMMLSHLRNWVWTGFLLTRAIFTKIFFYQQKCGMWAVLPRPKHRNQATCLWNADTLTKSQAGVALCLQRERPSVIQWWSFTPYRDICSTALCRNIDCNTLIRGQVTLAKPLRQSSFLPKEQATAPKQDLRSFITCPNWWVCLKISQIFKRRIW